MARLLHLETATHVCSVAVSEEGKLKAVEETDTRKNHSQYITTFVQKVLQTANLSFTDLQGVAVSSGPGSYTGLRIGASTAKGLCYGRSLPLISISTLKSLAAGLLSQWDEVCPPSLKNSQAGSIYLMPLIDSRQHEVYCAVYDGHLETVKAPQPQKVGELFNSETDDRPVVLFGPGTRKLSELPELPDNTFVIDSFVPSARYMVSLAAEKYNKQQFEDTAYFEPTYLKDFMGSKPNK
jgi:tRNA threonylcarbamoyladenosine biosynthesis protein TsaB